MTNETDAVQKAPAAPPPETNPTPPGGSNDNVHTPMDPTGVKIPLETKAACAGK